MAVAAIMAAAQTAKKIVPSGFGINTIRGIGGGAERDAFRAARLKRFEAGVEEGSVTATRYLLGMATSAVGHEKDWYASSIKTREARFPALFAEARRLGPLREVGDDPTGQTAIDAEVQKLTGSVRNAAAGFIQNVGSGLVNGTTQAVAQPGGELSDAVTIPTTQKQIVLVLLVVVVAFFLLKGRR